MNPTLRPTEKKRSEVDAKLCPAASTTPTALLMNTKNGDLTCRWNGYPSPIIIVDPDTHEVLWRHQPTDQYRLAIVRERYYYNHHHLRYYRHIGSLVFRY